MKSMTGYGIGRSETKDLKLVVEIKSVNGKFLDINIKSSRTFLCFEDLIKKIISSKLGRGTVDVFIQTKPNNESLQENISLNYELAKSLFDISTNLSEKLGIQNNILPKDIMLFENVIQIEDKEVDKELLQKALVEAVENATNMLIEAREIEGINLQKDLKQKIDNIERTISKIKEIAPLVETEYHTSLKKRIQEILIDVPINEELLLNEVAFFADKIDINEEISRLFSHIKRFNELLINSGPAGKQLEFLSQEITREINTLGSKANNLELTKLVLYMKNENEKIKEQIRNAE